MRGKVKTYICTCTMLNAEPKKAIGRGTGRLSLVYGFLETRPTLGNRALVEVENMADSIPINLPPISLMLDG